MIATAAQPAEDRRIAIAARAVEAACAAALAFMVGLLAWTLLAPESVAPVDAVERSVAPAAPAGPAVDRSILWRTNPFLAADAPAAETAEAAPATTLNLALFGVVAGTGDIPGSAFIRTPDNRQQAFREGDTIIDGVTLRRVLADRAIIDRNGAAETLYFEGVQRPDAVAPAGAAAGASPPAASPAQDAPAMDLTAQSLYDALRFEAEMRDGRVAGLRILPGSDPATLAAAGLAEGDLVLEIDSRSLAEVTDLSAMFEQLSGAQSVTVIVERAGARIPLTVTFGTPQ
jgi:type II secretion system protein C